MAKRNKLEEIKDTPKGDEGGTGGDPGTTSNIPSYLQAALRLPTSLPIGASVADESVHGTAGEVRTAPGIMVLDYIPTLGTSTSPVSPLNRASYIQFNAIRSQISGRRTYQPSDHMIARVSIDSLREFYYYLARIYKILCSYNALNLYQPKAMITAMGLNWDSWYGSRSELYQWLLVNANALKPYPTVPIGDISQRRIDFASYIYTDGEIDQAQMYIMNQRYYWSYEKVDSVKGLTLLAMPDTYDGAVDMWNNMYFALQNSADIYDIASDIRRAFPDTYITELTPPSLDATIEYKKFDSVLASIANAHILGLLRADDDNLSRLQDAFRIEDVQGYLKCNPAFQVTLNSGYISTAGNFTHLNMPDAAPTDTAIMDAMKLKPYLTVKRNGYTVDISVETMGSEILVSAYMASLSPTNKDSVVLTPFGSCLQFNTNSVQGVNALINTISKVACFDWHPTYMLLQYDSTSGNLVNTPRIVEDVANYIPITKQNSEQIFEAYVLSQFAID